MQSDIVVSILCLLSQRSLGRRTLVEQTGITESTVRTHLNKMKSLSWVNFAKAGTSLTQDGYETFASLLDTIKHFSNQMNLTDIGLGKRCCAIQLRGIQLPEVAWPLRDRALQGGASGALLLQYQNGIVFADTQDALNVAAPDSTQTLEQTFLDLQNDDLILIAFSDQLGPASRGLARMLVQLFDIELDKHKLNA